jgi:hypothetical protein
MAAKGDSKSGAMSRRKGVTFERKCARLFAAWWGGQVQRTPLSGAYAPEWRLAGDLMFVDPWPFEVEIRNRENWHLEQLFEGTGPVMKWIDEIEERAKDSGLRPMLVLHRNRVPALIVLRGEDLVALGWTQLTDVPVCVPSPRWAIMSLETFFARVSPDRVKTLISTTPGARKVDTAPDRPLDFT